MIVLRPTCRRGFAHIAQIQLADAERLQMVGFAEEILSSDVITQGLALPHGVLHAGHEGFHHPETANASEIKNEMNGWLGHLVHI